MIMTKIYTSVLDRHDLAPSSLFNVFQLLLLFSGLIPTSLDHSVRVACRMDWFVVMISFINHLKNTFHR